MTVDAYYMEMEMLLQHARVREAIEMTMLRFLHRLKFTIKSIVWHHQYYTMNDLLHLAWEVESQLAEEAQLKAKFTSSSRFSLRTPSAAPMENYGANTRASSSVYKPGSNGYMAKKLAAPATSAGSNMSTSRN